MDGPTKYRQIIFNSLPTNANNERPQKVQQVTYNSPEIPWKEINQMTFFQACPVNHDL